MTNPFLAPKDAPAPPVRAALNYLLVCVGVIVAFWASLSVLNLRFDFGFVARYHSRIVDGFVLTVEISLFSLVLSLVLGTLVALGQGAVCSPVI